MMRRLRRAVSVWLAIAFTSLAWAGLALAQDLAQDPAQNETTDTDDDLIDIIEKMLAEQDAPDPELQRSLDTMKEMRDGPVFDPLGYGLSPDISDPSVREAITAYDVDIDVQSSGDIVVTETIDVMAGGQEIRRGIFRELPTRYRFMGVTLDYQYTLLGVTRDGNPENVATQYNDNAVTFRIGRANYFLRPGPYRYEIRYRVADQIRRHDDRDELYWNATGTYWNFPIDRVRTRVTFPNGSEIVDTSAYTGARGSDASAATIQVQGNSVVFETPQPLPRKAGLTVSTSIAKGVIAPLSKARKAELFRIRYGAPILLAIGGLAILIYYLLTWHRIGRDPQPLPVFPRYAPPKMNNGKPYSPAAIHYIHHKGFRDMDALSSMLMRLGGKGVLDIEANKNTTIIKQLSAYVDHPDEKALIDRIMKGRDGELVLDGGTDKDFFLAVSGFHQEIARKYGPKYYKRNLGWAVLGFIISGVLAMFVFLSPVSLGGPLVFTLFAGLLILNIAFAALLPAPTKHGAKVSSAIEGFALYLKTAEEKRINTANPLGERPPAMTTELYERFLPYAMALGLEKPWTKQFESSLPTEAAEYKPTYARGSALRAGSRSPVGFGRTLNKTLTAGVAAAAPVSQSSGSSGGFSSGSSGGGFSGGGGGGGGGGGW